MEEENDIHHYKKRLEAALRQIKESDIIEENKSAISQFTTYLLVKKLSTARIEHYIQNLKICSQISKKPFKEMVKDDVMYILSEIMKKEEWGDKTKYDFQVTIKVFFKWLKGTDDYPPEVKWIKPIKSVKKMVIPEEILTEEEILALANKTDNIRDKSFVLTLAEGGLRIGEAINLRIKQIQPLPNGTMAITVDGKTGRRRMLLISSAPALANWLDTHPLKDNPDSFVWISLSYYNKFKRLNYGFIRSLLVRLAKYANIKKRVNPHSFRHARATHLANKLTEAQMKQYFGWTQSSDMASVYVHLSGRDLDNALLKLSGLSQEDNKKEEILKVQVCKCGEKNDPTRHFCGKCGAPLSLKIALDTEDKKNKKDELLAKVLENDDELLQILIDKIKKKGLYEEFLRS